MTHAVVFDNEAVQALGRAEHPKHRRVIAHVQVVADRKKRGVPIAPVVPAAVRVEAGWDRTNPVWALASHLRIADAELGTVGANLASAIRSRVGSHISVVDAHVGAVIQSLAADRITVLTSDPDDIRSVAETTDITIVPM